MVNKPETVEFAVTNAFNDLNRDLDRHQEFDLLAPGGGTVHLSGTGEQNLVRALQIWDRDWQKSQSSPEASKFNNYMTVEYPYKDMCDAEAATPDVLSSLQMCWRSKDAPGQSLPEKMVYVAMPVRARSVVEGIKNLFGIHSWDDKRIEPGGLAVETLTENEAYRNFADRLGRAGIKVEPGQDEGMLSGGDAWFISNDFGGASYRPAGVRLQMRLA